MLVAHEPWFRGLEFQMHIRAGEDLMASSSGYPWVSWDVLLSASKFAGSCLQGRDILIPAMLKAIL